MLSQGFLQSSVITRREIDSLYVGEKIGTQDERMRSRQLALNDKISNPSLNCPGAISLRIQRTTEPPSP